MTQKEAIEKVLNLIDKTGNDGSGSYVLYAESKTLRMCNRGEMPKASALIAPLTGFDINRGLPSERWDLIENRIRKLIEKGLL